MRSFIAVAAQLILTPFYAGVVLVASLLGIKDREGSIYRRAPRDWGRLICWLSGVRIHTHGMEKLRDGTPRLLLANHVSAYDVFALAAILPRMNFVAKAELGGVPLLGGAGGAAGQLFIERGNRKSAFAVYDAAAARVREGAMVIIFPEGTRADSYVLRPFKKGPFVLAVAARVPIVPVLIHGSLEVQRKGSLRVRAGDIHVHFLDDIATEGLTYDDRDALAQQVHAVMRRAQESRYGIASPPWSTSSSLIPISS
jgi:1-acyl-sn-glycerol-3-phosphate acyltransferase